MTSAHRTQRALGIVALLLVVPAIAAAQRGTRAAVGGSRGGAITAPRPSPRPLVGFGTLPRSGGRPNSTWSGGAWNGGSWNGGSWNGGRMTNGGWWFRGNRNSQNPHNFVPCFNGGLRCVGGNTWLGPSRNGFYSFPYVYGYDYGATLPYQVPVYVPYPVGGYQPAPMYSREPEEPAKPYNPANSKMVTIGAGADGGGGVMRIERVNAGTLRVTWLGSVKPIRDAKLFLADSLQHVIRSQPVDLQTPSVLFKIEALEPRIAYTGLTVVYADGATQTTLVPFRRSE